MKNIYRIYSIFFLCILSGENNAAPLHSPKLDQTGLGHFKFGMSLPSANAYLEHKLIPVKVELRANPVCQYIPVQDMPGVSFVFLNDRLERIDVSKPNFSSVDGLTVGDKEDHVVGKLKKAKREPLDHVPEGVTLVTERMDEPNGISYQIYDGKLMRMIAGDKKVIRYSEGCE